MSTADKKPVRRQRRSKVGRDAEGAQASQGVPPPPAAAEDARATASKALDAARPSVQAVLPAIGPVVGKCTETTARVLLEWTDEGEHSVTLRSGDTTVSQTLVFPADTPTVVVFQELTEGTAYELLVDGYGPVGRVQTWSQEVSANAKVCFVSCNGLFRGQGAKQRVRIDTWDQLNEFEPDLILHLGDNVYADNAFGRAKLRARDFRRQGMSEEELKINQHLRAPYRTFYRSLWNYKPVKRALAYANNIMVRDDHEIIDDSPSFPENTAEADAARAGRTCYAEYQLQLTAPLSDWPVSIGGTGPEGVATGQFHEYPTFAVMMPDSRSFRTDRVWFTEEEKEKIRDFLQKIKVDTLFVGLQTYPLHTNRFIARLGRRWGGVEDWASRDIWLADYFVLLAELKQWKEAGTAKRPRDILTVSGDVHSSFVAEVRHRDAPKDEIFMIHYCASPIGSVLSHQRGLIGCCNTCCRMTMFGDWKFRQTRREMNRNCFLTINMADGRLSKHTLRTNTYEVTKKGNCWPFFCCYCSTCGVH